MQVQFNFLVFEISNETAKFYTHFKNNYTLTVEKYDFTYNDLVSYTILLKNSLFVVIESNNLFDCKQAPSAFIYSFY